MATLGEVIINLKANISDMQSGSAAAESMANRLHSRWTVSMRGVQRALSHGGFAIMAFANQIQSGQKSSEAFLGTIMSIGFLFRGWPQLIAMAGSVAISFFQKAKVEAKKLADAQITEMKRVADVNKEFAKDMEARAGEEIDPRIALRKGMIERRREEMEQIRLEAVATEGGDIVMRPATDPSRARALREEIELLEEENAEIEYQNKLEATRQDVRERGASAARANIARIQEQLDVYAGWRETLEKARTMARPAPFQARFEGPIEMYKRIQTAAASRIDRQDEIAKNTKLAADALLKLGITEEKIAKADAEMVALLKKYQAVPGVMGP